VLSSPRAADLNNDGVLDIVIGGGVDGFPKTNGIMAIDGATGAALWTAPCDNEMFGSAVFMDITSDGIPDVFIGGRHDQFYALNGQTGALYYS
jgi:outer membrane protein assembly factor BamB